jgi:hypothetical protein
MLHELGTEFYSYVQEVSDLEVTISRLDLHAPPWV